MYTCVAGEEAVAATPLAVMASAPELVKIAAEDPAGQKFAGLLHG
jgi:hypothetical protein